MDTKLSPPRWRVVFYRDAQLPPSVRDDRLVLRHAEAIQRTFVRLTTGRPILVDSAELPDVRVNRWFASDELRGLDPLTWRKYAYSLVVWLNFIAAYGLSWDEADAESIDAFKVWRTADERNERCVAPGTFKHDLIAIQQFYRWALDEYGVHNPIRVRRGRWPRWDGTVSERPIAAPNAVRDRNVKWFDPAGYARYRDVGLLGLTFGGDEDPGFRGRNPQRDSAFAEGLYGTGLRLEEWGSVLLAELPPDSPNQAYATCHLGAATAKGGRGRQYWMPRKTLGEVLDYVDGERATAVRRAQRAGRYELISDARVLATVVGARRVRLRSGDGVVTETSLDSLTPASRRRLMVQTPAGVEPAALWLGQDGLPRVPHSWEHTFANANKRLASKGLTGFAGAPHMLRHSFALRWYAVGRLAYQAQVGFLTADEVRDFREEFGSAWDLVQLLLGHRDQRTTRETYLEPFQSLDIELLLMHAAQAAVPSVLAEVLRQDGRVLGDPLAAKR